MTPQSLKAWRKRLGWSQAEAARQLDLSPNAYGALEAGKYLDGRSKKRPEKAPVRIKRHVALACAAIAFGLPEWEPEQEILTLNEYNALSPQRRAQAAAKGVVITR